MDILPNEPLRNSTPAYLIDHSLPPLPTTSHSMSSTSPSPVGIYAHEQIPGASPVSTPTSYMDPQAIPTYIPTMSAPPALATPNSAQSFDRVAADPEDTVPAHLPQFPLPTFTSPATRLSQDLTEEQIGRIGSMVQRLLRQRVPLPVVSTVMEGMLNEEGADGPSTGGESSRVGATIEHPEVGAPPSYDFK